MRNILCVIDCQQEYTSGKDNIVQEIKKETELILYDEINYFKFKNDDNSFFRSKINYEIQNPQPSYVIDSKAKMFDRCSYSILTKQYRKYLSDYNNDVCLYLCGFNMTGSVLSSCFALWDKKIDFKILLHLTELQGVNYSDGRVQMLIKLFGSDTVLM